MPNLTLMEFFDLMQDNLSSDRIKTIDKLHTKFVRLVLIEDTLRYRVYSGGSLSWGFMTPSAPKPIEVNCRHLIIYNQDGSSVVEKFSLNKAVAKWKRSAGLFKKRGSNLTILIPLPNGRKTIIEISFDPFRDDYKIFQWTEAVRQAAEMIDHRTDPLSTEYHLHDLRDKYRHPVIMRPVIKNLDMRATSEEPELEITRQHRRDSFS